MGGSGHHPDPENSTSNVVFIQIKAVVINDNLEVTAETHVHFDSMLPEYRTSGGVHAGAGGRVWAMDCEMVNTTVGSELARVTLIDHAGETEYESLVMPDNRILDYNTRFSGIRAEDLVGVTTRLRDVQAQLLFKIDARDIMIGHSLESDLRAVKLLHSMVVDTSVVFPHKMGPPYKRALRTLAVEQIQRIIQNDGTSM